MVSEGKDHAHQSGFSGQHSVCVLSWFRHATLCSGRQPTRLLCPSDSPGKNVGVGGHALLQGIFPTQESNPDLLCLLQILNHRANKEAQAAECQPANNEPAGGRMAASWRETPGSRRWT